jgi:hypothetical protein
LTSELEKLSTASYAFHHGSLGREGQQVIREYLASRGVIEQDGTIDVGKLQVALEQILGRDAAKILMAKQVLQRPSSEQGKQNDNNTDNARQQESKASESSSLKIPRFNPRACVKCHLHKIEFNSHKEYRRHVKEEHNWMDVNGHSIASSGTEIRRYFSTHKDMAR